MLVNKLKQLGVSLLMLTSFFASVAFLTPTTASAAACTDYSNILTFPNWYRGVYVNTGTDCTLQFDNIDDTWIVVSNIIEILMQAVGYVAVGFIIYGGFKYLTSQGESAALTAAKSTITHAVVGLVISIVSVLLLNLLVGVFGLRTQGDNLEVVDAPPGTTTTSGSTPSTTGTDSSTDDRGPDDRESRGGSF